MLSQEILEQLEECKDAKEIQALAKANGYDLTDEQAQKAYDAINSERELTEEELSQVAGGECTRVMPLDEFLRCYTLTF